MGKIGNIIKLQGVVLADAAVLQELSSEQLDKWFRGNDVWALAVVEPTNPQTQYSDTSIPAVIKTLLLQYDDVFQHPKGLPLSRSYDHSITLLPGVAPVNSRPYRYAPHQKDEIERQVSDKLASGIVTTSISPFASPVLLVKKKDGTWCSCVDFWKLNDVTVKNRFPMPIVDEIWMN